MITLEKARGRPLLTLLVGLTVPLAAALPLAGTPVWAQSAPILMAIEVPAGFEIEASAESPLPIRITPEAAIPAKAMVLIRGLPQGTALTEGRLFDSGVWAVRAADLPLLRIAAPARSIEKQQLSISLVTFDGIVLAEAVSALAVIPAKAAGPRTTATLDGGPPQSSTEQEPTLTLEQVEHAQLFMQKGEENLHADNIIVARLFFMRAANAGWAPGALAVARTYDPFELQRLTVAGGINPDAALARKWYKKAEKLGSLEARDRLRRLENPQVLQPDAGEKQFR